MILKNNIPFVLLIVLLSFCSSSIEYRTQVYIRVNQAGYLPDKPKSAVILSKYSLLKMEYNIYDTQKKNIAYRDSIGSSYGKYASFDYTYKIDFSKLTKPGNYKLIIDENESYPFTIAEDVFSSVPAKLLTFFRIQRCGYTSPENHEICHIADATSLVSKDGIIDTSIDLTGGWHDAGDYIKFLSTTAYSTYTLLFAYDVNPLFFEYDDNQNNIPDVLDEAKIGLDWMLRCNYEKYKLISQVQDLRDHNIGWRLPENDSLQYDRPAIAGIGKNTIGIYAAVMALASKIWRQKIKYDEFADKCLTVAENLYSVRNHVQDIDSSTNGIYQDNNYLGKLALGAFELYNITGRKELLADAKKYAAQAGPEYWWSYSEVTDYAFFRLAGIDTSFADYIKQSLVHFNNKSSSNLFGTAVDFYWGSNHTTSGIALKVLLWKSITGKNDFDKLAFDQLDYILGKNPWGVSFIANTGHKFSANFHHQVSFLKKIILPGGFAAGPVKKEIITRYNIPYETVDNLHEFQTDEAYYRDDRMDYITNEPTIIANATGILLFGSIY
ncbi:MAG: glycoside hydrolase family 9 protein [Melioribacteraceae bacterium]|nr:glycoside hydrolase family 9 protein [Melioribacteraceae bacterium]